MTKANSFLYSLPESLTGTKDDPDYPLANIESCSFSFRKNLDGTIDNENIRIAVSSVVKILYRHGFLTTKPIKVTEEESVTENIDGNSYTWVSIGAYFDKSDHQ